MKYSYIHKTQYYESDQMGIMHHSNYIRWFEEARIAMMDDLGYAYARLEHEGIVSPVLSVSCNYRKMLRFGDVVRIETEIDKFNGIKIVFKYKVYLESTGELCADGESSHCFLNADFKPISIKKTNKEFYDKMKGTNE